MDQKKWWEQAIIYQIYPRSFKDTNGDGIGDIKGIIQKLDYVKSLGVNTIWINPMVKSKQVDKGYDVIDYRKIDPLFGTAEEGAQLIEEIHKRNMKVIYDLPLNHTSDEHPWFKEALKGKDNFYRNYYIWADKEKNQPYPNNWLAAFGGSAWSRELKNDGQYYLHLFKDQMPDLNWDYPPVRQEITDIIDYWIGKGIDGFRLDAFIYLDVNKEFPNHPDDWGEGQDMNEHGGKIHPYLSDVWKKLSNKLEDIFIIGEATTADIETASWYTQQDKNTIDKIITMAYFPEKETAVDENIPAGNQHAPLDFQEFKQTQCEFQKHQRPNGGPILYWSNHDLPRSAHKFGDMEKHRDNTAKMMAAMMYLQKGIPIIYYGEEIGMKNISFDDPGNIEDAGAADFYEAAYKHGWKHKDIMKHLNLTVRDVSRGIMQWDDSKNTGFSDAAPWTLYNPEAAYNVKEQEKDRNSILNFYRKVIELKKMDLFQSGSYEMMDSADPLYVYERNLDEQKALVVSSFSSREEKFTLEDSWDSSHIILQNDGNSLNQNTLILAPYGTVVLVNKE